MKNRNIFNGNIQIPEIVQNRMNDTLKQIKEGATDSEGDSRKTPIVIWKKSIFTKSAAAIVVVCCLLITSFTAFAAIWHFWSRGMQGTIRATDTQQQDLIDQGVVIVLDDTNTPSASLSVTDSGITISPVETIVDENFAYISFYVDGFNLEIGEEPMFEDITQYVVSNTDKNEKIENLILNMTGKFYSGIIFDENLEPLYEDGTQIERTESGMVIGHYADDNGRLEFIMMLSPAYKEMNLIGKTIHVHFENIGIVKNGILRNKVVGQWNFNIPLSGQVAEKNLNLGERLGNTKFIIDTVDISPISIDVKFSVTGNVEIYADDMGIPDFCGVILKDGTKILYLSNGGSAGYTDETMQTAYEQVRFNRVVDVCEVKSLLFWTERSEDYVEIILP